MQSTIKEWNLLLKACQAAISATPINLTQNELEGLDWNKLYAMIRAHKVTALFYKGLTTCPDLTLIPSSFQNKLKQQSLYFVTRNLKNSKELFRLIKLFEKERIEVIPYKGIVLADMAYQELGLRESSDIDILIQPDDFESIKAILIKEGYRPSFYLSRFLHQLFFKLYCEYNFDLYEGTILNRSTRQFHVEPHWVLGSKMYQTYIDYQTIHTLTAKGQILGTSINKLSPEGLLITTAVHHGGSDQWLHLKTVMDIATILQRFENELDWTLILKTCEKAKITNLVVLGLSLSQALFNSPLPNSVYELLSRKEIVELTQKRKEAFIHLTQRPHFANYFINRILFQWKLRKNWGTKFKVIYYHFIHALLRPFLYWGEVKG